MKKFKLTKETISLALIVILSALLNFVNLGIEGTANSYYAAAVKSMTVNWKNFFFVSFDPAGFVTIDKPPLGFWLQAISAKIFGFSGWSIILPQALAGVISVVLIYIIVKKSFGSIAGLISALCLAVTPVFVAVSRNNSVDNVLVLALLFACWALSIAAEKGKLKYLIISMVLVGLGFNIKMLQAYMVAPALYITYLLSSATSIKKRIIHLVIATAVLLSVSLSWALIVDFIPASSRPYVDSSTNNTVMELILGHNGLERISLSSSSTSKNPGGNPGGAPGENGQPPAQPGSNTNANSSSNTTENQVDNSSNSNSDSTKNQANQPGPGNPQSGNGPMGSGAPTMHGNGGNGSSGLQGTFGGETKSGITRLFSKNILSDQIVWFIPLAVLGFIASAIKENLKFRLDNKRKQSLVLWFMWFLPAFVYFSYNTGTFHSYYLTMLAPPIAALTGIGITSMWELYKEGGWKSWLLPVSLVANGAAQLLMLYYFISSSTIIIVLMALLVILCFGSSLLLTILNLIKKKNADLNNTNENSSESKNIRIKKSLVTLALVGLLVTPLVGSSAAMLYKLNGSFPAAGLELLSNTQDQMPNMNTTSNGNTNSKLVEFLQKNKTENQKYLLVVSNSNSCSEIIINTGESVMSLGGFLGKNNPLTLEEFKNLVKKGEIRYVMTGGQGGGNSSSDIMNWVQQAGTVVPTSEYSDSNVINNDKEDNSANMQNKDTINDANVSQDNSTNSHNQNSGKFEGRNSGQLYDLKAYTDSSSTN